MSLAVSSVEGPLSIIARIKEEGDWPRAVLMLSIYLEKHGYLAVKEHFESLKIPIDKEHLERRMHLLDYGFILLAAGKIDSEEFQTLKLINSIRNKWVHRKERYGYSIGTRAKKEYLPLLRKGEELLRKLFITKIFVGR